MRNHCYLVVLFCCFHASQAQQPIQGIRTGMVVPEKVKCAISSEGIQRIDRMIQDSIRSLQQKGVLSAATRAEQVLFNWPLRQAAAFSDPGYYTITNFVDHDPASPNQLRDYNCGVRTYDANNGNHRGTDIASFPFGWQKMADNVVEIIAAAEGVIIAKSDGQPDQSCLALIYPTENGVYIRHADGSVAWYIHLKTGSLTTKAVGSTVAKGEYLGIMGSSGLSSGPHLHFEVRDVNNAVIDPFAGNCNSLNGTTSWWANQQPYYNPGINKVMTHSAATAGGCANEEAVNAKNVFLPGESIYCAAYFRDLLANTTANYRVYTPANAIHASWDFKPTDNFPAAFGYIFFGAPALLGNWRLEVTYNGKTVVHPFTVANTLPASVKVSPLTNLTPCAGQALTVNYTTTGTFNGNNTFTAYLSDSYGNFNNETAIGTSTTGGAISAVIPVTTPSGVGYKIRIKASNPAFISDQSAAAMIISNIGTPQIFVGGTSSFCPGGQVTLTSSAATGNQWLKDGVAIGGATAVTYVATAAGNYSVKVTSGNCTGTSAVATVVVNPLPPVPAITPGGPVSFCTGGSVTLTSSAVTGNQWYKDGVAIAGATNTTYSANAAGSYTVRATNMAGCHATSAAQTVTVNALPAAPAISSGGPVAFCTGSSVILTSSASTGNQWYKDGVSISGAVNTTYTANTTGNYTVTTTNAAGCTAISAVLSVTANPLPAVPVITAGGPVAFCAGGNVILTSSSATGNQWLKDGLVITGAVNTTYTANAAGGYTVRVTNTNGCVAVSAATAVTVNPIPAKPAITRNSGDLLSSVATGNQWFLEGIAIAGATGNTFRPSASGNFTVQVTQNGCISPPSDNYYFLITGIVDPNALENKVQVFPNPVQERLYINNRLTRPLKAQLYDITGKEIITTQTKSGTHELPVTQLLRGAYILLLTDQQTNQSYRIKLIKP
ncbi:MAG: peptidoglycan DD-metalloendopeptidase family protein [Niastella sp.]|nr:peptidoglycan DD-metalloendopeptidase family protein [Niastella sp.]